jgi:hypothetical protein
MMVVLVPLVEAQPPSNQRRAPKRTQTVQNNSNNFVCNLEKIIFLPTRLQHKEYKQV